MSASALESGSALNAVAATSGSSVERDLELMPVSVLARVANISPCRKCLAQAPPTHARSQC